MGGKRGNPTQLKARISGMKEAYNGEIVWSSSGSNAVTAAGQTLEGIVRAP